MACTGIPGTPESTVVAIMGGVGVTGDGGGEQFDPVGGLDCILPKARLMAVKSGKDS